MTAELCPEWPERIQGALIADGDDHNLFLLETQPFVFHVVELIEDNDRTCDQGDRDCELSNDKNTPKPRSSSS